MNEKELIRRALMGNKQAQEECIEKGILLPCPFCGNEAQLVSEEGLYTVACKDGACIANDIHPECGEAMFALEEWYTEDNEQAFMLESDFCSYFEPKEEE